MASKISDDERKRRVYLVGTFFLEEKSSIRKTAAFFTENFFSISSATVHDYLNRFINKYPNTKEQILSIIESNKEDSIEKHEVRERVLKNLKLALSGYTVEEISVRTNTSYWTVYRDLRERLPKIDEEYYKQVVLLLSENKERNLRHGK